MNQKRFPHVGIEGGRPAPPGVGKPNLNRPPFGDGPRLAIGRDAIPDVYAKVLNPQQYSFFIQGSILVPALTLAPVKFLDQSSQLRNFLGITNVARGAGVGCNYIIGFGSAADPASPWLTIPDGIMIAFDTNVPQNDLWVGLDNAANTGGQLAFIYSTISG
jgi:hypothetical protein